MSDKGNSEESAGAVVTVKIMRWIIVVVALAGVVWILSERADNNLRACRASCDSSAALCDAGTAGALQQLVCIGRQNLCRDDCEWRHPLRPGDLVGPH